MSQKWGHRALVKMSGSFELSGKMKWKGCKAFEHMRQQHSKLWEVHIHHVGKENSYSVVIKNSFSGWKMYAQHCANHLAIRKWNQINMCFFMRSCRWKDVVWICYIPVLAFSYIQHPTIFPFTLSPHLSSFIPYPALQHRIPLVLYSRHSLQLSDSPSRCQWTAACAYCISGDIFSITVIKQTTKPHQKLQVYAAAAWQLHKWQRSSSPSNFKPQWNSTSISLEVNKEGG